MPFECTSSTDDKIVYKSPREGAAWKPWAIAGGLLAIALVFNRLDPSLKTTAYLILQFVFLLLGCFILAILIFQPVGNHLDAPDLIVFDRQRGVMELVSEEGITGEKFAIPLREVLRVAIYEQQKSDKDGRARIVLHLYVELKGGDEWYLYSSQFGDTVRTQHQQLEKLIANANMDAAATTSHAPKSWKLNTSQTDTVASWTIRIDGRPWRLIVRSILYVSFFAWLTHLTLTKDKAGDSIMLFIIMSPFAALGGWVLIRGFKRLFRDMRTRFAVRVTNTGIEYYEFAKEGGAQRNHVQVPLDAIETIRYRYSPERVLQHEIEVVRRNNDDALLIPSDLTAFERQVAVRWLREKMGYSTSTL